MAGRNGDAAKQRMAAAPAGSLPSLLSELLANIHDRLELLDRIAFATALATFIDDDVFSPPAPWLVLPYEKKNPANATLFSIADRRAATVHASDPAMRGHVVLGSSQGWLATVDNRGQIHLVNPATGEQRALPDITTMGVFTYVSGSFSVWVKRYLTAQFGGGPPFGDNSWGREGHGSIRYDADEMRLRFYRKVVLSVGRRARSHAAMLIMYPLFSAPAFATAEDGAAWTVAQSRDGVEDAIYHGGRFHSVSYTGVVEAWERDSVSGVYTSTAIAPRLTTNGIEGEEGRPSRKYLAAAPSGKLMVVVKYVKGNNGLNSWKDSWTGSFKVHVLGDDGQWKETRDIGNASLFIRLNNSLCMPTRGHPEIEAGCVYFTDDELWEAALRKRNRDICWYGDGDEDESDVRPAGVYSLKDGTVKRVDGLSRQQYRNLLPTPPVWIIPTIP